MQGDTRDKLVYTLPTKIKDFGLFGGYLLREP